MMVSLVEELSEETIEKPAEPERKFGDMRRSTRFVDPEGMCNK